MFKLLVKIINENNLVHKKGIEVGHIFKLGNNYSNPKVNLDVDFSVSKGGYRLRPHRDDITRLYNFLIYLTDIPKKMEDHLPFIEKKLKIKND